MWLLIECQTRFDEWRTIYNVERPHEELGLDVPISRYECSNRTYPESLEPFEYAPDDEVRKVQKDGFIWLNGNGYKIPRAFYRLHYETILKSRES